MLIVLSVDFIDCLIFSLAPCCWCPSSDVQISPTLVNRDVKVVFSRLSFLTSQWQLVAPMYCCEVWCRYRGGWWRGRPTNRLDRHADRTDCLCMWLATRRSLSREMNYAALLYERPSMTGTHRHPNGRPRRPISLSPTSETDLSREHSFNRRECGGGRGERRVVNNRCETMCTSRRRLLLDNAATRWRWGRGEHGILSSRQSAITPTSQ